MTPIAPSGNAVALPPLPQDNGQRQSPAAAEPPAAPRPDLGRAAVTQAEATAKAALGVPGHPRSPVPEIPPDPPPVKGLGIPPLDTRTVGDLDEAPATPPALSDLLGALRPPGPRGLDLRL